MGSRAKGAPGELGGTRTLNALSKDEKKGWINEESSSCAESRSRISQASFKTSTMR